MASTTSFPADVVPQAPEDALFGLMRAYRADESPNKIDLVTIHGTWHQNIELTFTRELVPTATTMRSLGFFP